MFVVDGHPVHALYGPPGEPDLSEEQVDASWRALHIQEFQCLLQIVKCEDQDCCGMLRSSIRNVLLERVIKISQGTFGLI